MKSIKELYESICNEEEKWSRLMFYRNRAGENLSPEDEKRLENAENKLQKLYEE